MSSKIPPSNPFSQGETFYQHYQKLAEFVRTRDREPPRILVITDIEQDYDDLLAVIFLAEMHRMGAVQLVGFVANHHPAEERAKFLRSVLHLLGLPDLPVGKGTRGAEDLVKHPWDFYYGLKNKTFREAAWNNNPFPNGSTLIQQLATTSDTPLTLLLISSLQDIGEFFGKHEKHTFLNDKFAKFVSQGGYHVGQTEAGAVSIAPDEGMTNNTFNLHEAKTYTRVLASHKLPSDAWSREAAKAARLPASFMQQLFTLGPIGAHLQWLWLRQEFKFYWDPYNWPFMPRLDPSWYLTTRLGLDKSSPRYAQLLKDPHLPFATARQDIKVIAYDCCAAVGAVGDDFMRAFGVLAPEEDVPAYNRAAHQHRVFGKAPADLGGIDASRLAGVMEAFLLGGLKATAAHAAGRPGFEKGIEHTPVEAAYDLDVFLREMLPRMKVIEGQKKTAKNCEDEAKKIAEKEGKSGAKYRELAKQAAEAKERARKVERELAKVPGLEGRALPTRDQLPYEQLYQRAMSQLGGKAKV
ncbi:hypothetical protein C8A05DRAFT_19393 [Staphylotrichum tortipilum]|uniref:Inosine/uridine-preferring nucleoside hydrolase domain-containing protein n=1 Tax=Staphylotrichum tortipilum TaxID=2831512 RepID=A0AAN6MDI1_9PEZI|nr:hypothetical protein C8A05DRAFT_19393 [Staphylotrichum longicolle]